MFGDTSEAGRLRGGEVLIFYHMLIFYLVVSDVRVYAVISLCLILVFRPLVVIKLSPLEAGASVGSGPSAY